jgi:hypothetical protein
LRKIRMAPQSDGTRKNLGWNQALLGHEKRLANTHVGRHKVK